MVEGFVSNPIARNWVSPSNPTIIKIVIAIIKIINTL
jgi:hypothetical protein